MRSKFNDINKNVLLKLPNPRYEHQLKKYHYLSRLCMNDKHTNTL